jgi:hypothetical protein
MLQNNEIFGKRAKVPKFCSLTSQQADSSRPTLLVLKFDFGLELCKRRVDDVLENHTSSQFSKGGPNVLEKTEVVQGSGLCGSNDRRASRSYDCQGRRSAARRRRCGC